MAAILKIAMTS